MTIYQFYPKCFPTTHTFYKKCLIPQSKDTFIDLANKSSKLETYTRQAKYILSKDLGYLFGYDKLSDKADMLYSNGPIYCGKENWVLDIMDNPFGMTGYNFNIFKNNISKIESSLAADNCKKIIVRSEDSIDIMKKYFSDKIISKISLEKIELPKKIYEKKDKPYFQILFMGSINNPGDFYNKGGLIALEAFEKLADKNIRLIVRCDVPEELNERLNNNSNIKVIKNRLTDEEIDSLYKESDILIATNPVMSYMVTLEAKSYGLPTICYDGFAIKSYIKDGVDGYILTPPTKLRNILKTESYPSNLRTLEILEALKEVDSEIVNKVCSIIKERIKNEKR
jgi:glycosyltransferase involved in cell wall biosynthesis